MNFESSCGRHEQAPNHRPDEGSVRIVSQTGSERNLSTLIALLRRASPTVSRTGIDFRRSLNKRKAMGIFTDAARRVVLEHIGP
jgi:hypothetical protein